MRDDSRPIDSTGWEPVIKINNGETAVCPGEFYRLRRINAFVKEYEDKDDSLKLYGITADGTVYVSVKCDDDMTDEEFDEWARRSGCAEVKDIVILTEEEALAKLRNIPDFKGRVSY